jgi:probable selenium-dependent hydroxylase accessory protein YqeC
LEDGDWMRFVEEFDIDIRSGKRELVTLVGAGGKTSTMFALAGELKLQGRSVLVTTTTAIYYPEAHCFDEIILSDKIEFQSFKMTSEVAIYVLGSKVNEDGKLLGVNKELINNIFRSNIFDYILVEGDGSKRLPIKAPAEHEPVVPELTTKVIGVIGMDALGKEINSENVHRPELFCEIVNCSIGDYIDEDKILRLIQCKNGLFKGTPKNAGKYLLLNKVEANRDYVAIEFIKSEVSRRKLNVMKIIQGLRKEVI